MSYDDLRAALPQDLPWAIKEAIIGNVVVGNFTWQTALIIGRAIDKKIPLEPDLFTLDK